MKIERTMNTRLSEYIVSLLLMSCSCLFVTVEAVTYTTSGGDVQVSSSSGHKTSHQTRPHIRTEAKQSNSNNMASTNWSGYAAATNLTNPEPGSVTFVSGSWTVPTVQNCNESYSAIWVGIDGFSENSSTVEQLGTGQDVVNGVAQYYAWYEMYPGNSEVIENFNVYPGDSITASVTYSKKNGNFTLYIANKTRGTSHTVVQSLKSATMTSAEWVVEAPYSNFILPLANFGTVSFTNCQATINNITGTINNHAWQNGGIEMVNNCGAAKDMPSGLTSNGAGFSVAWSHA